MKTSPNEILWIWYVSMCTISIVNMSMLIYLYKKIKATTFYEKIMKSLAIPWTFECGYRCFFPSLYLQRYVFWDTPLNSILIDRTLAFIGEMCWVTQTALALVYVSYDVLGKRTTWIELTGVAAVLVYLVAEFTSYYNTATTNEFYAALEVILDGASYLLMWPASMYLFCKCQGRIFGSSGKAYLFVMILLCLIYPAYNFFVDAPMYMERYHEDQRNHKSYFTFWSGLKDAAVRRVPTRQYEDWSQDMGWMTAYFTIGVWSSLLMMYAPRIVSSLKRAVTVNLPLLV